MKKFIVIIIIIFIGVITLSGCSSGYNKQSSAGDLKINLSVDRYPLVKSDNTLNIRVIDSSGNPVTNAVVHVRYYMPPMPGMAPMEFNTQASLSKDRYSFTANIPMEGGWKVAVTAARPGMPAVSAMFNLDAR